MYKLYYIGEETVLHHFEYGKGYTIKEIFYIDMKIRYTLNIGLDISKCFVRYQEIRKLKLLKIIK